MATKKNVLPAPPPRRARDYSGDEWHLDKRVPIVLILAIVGQTFAAGWWARGISARVDYLERAQAASMALTNRVSGVEGQIAGVEGKIDLIQTGVQDIKSTINAITVVQVRPVTESGKR